ncbi:MAG: hypothetical protein JEZ01_11515 [Labilibaculum sp.]|nr:hypothetical protein [Labilibaculum sp.]MBI9058380.1 hypothetical protein [Labilibaculum sp.]
MAQKKVVTVGMELLKTVAGVTVGRYACVMGGNALKVNEEADPKKAKIKKIAIGGGVLAVGTIGALKAPQELKSVFAGVATAGVLAAVTPFAKEDKGFIPALHGSLGTATLDDEDQKIALELNSLEDYQAIIDEEQEDDDYMERKLRGTDEEIEGDEMVIEVN